MYVCTQRLCKQFLVPASINYSEAQFHLVLITIIVRAFKQVQSMDAFLTLDQTGNLTEQDEQEEMNTKDTPTIRNWMCKKCY
jgi:hypothetical protein